jgi:methionine-S-sulfoxide reductase
MRMRFKTPMTGLAWSTLGLLALTLAACGQATGGSTPPPPPAANDTEDKPAKAEASATRQTVLAGGCFWCVEAVFERVEGVKKVVSGYAGGKEMSANYREVSRGMTEHAEVVQITYDPQTVKYPELLRIFFATHDPTQLNRQGPDVGKQYRSAIFYANEREKRLAEQYIQQMEQAGTYDEPIVTTLEKLTGFYPAETYHQDYVKNNPDDPYVQQYVPPKLEKLEKLEKHFADQLKDE